METINPSLQKRLYNSVTGCDLTTIFYLIIFIKLKLHFFQIVHLAMIIFYFLALIRRLLKLLPKALLYK